MVNVIDDDVSMNELTMNAGCIFNGRIQGNENISILYTDNIEDP